MSDRPRMRANMERTQRLLVEIDRKKQIEVLEAAKDALKVVAVLAALMVRHSKPKPWYRKIF